jgi:hypothetical protein
MRTTPSFGIGQCDNEVADYAWTAVVDLCDRIGIGHEPLCSTFMVALRANARTMAGSLSQSLVPCTPESRILFDLIGELLVGNVKIQGYEYLLTALDLIVQGHNVLLTSNHTSGADSLVLEHIVNTRSGPGTTASWVYAFGHAVNLYLMPLTSSAGVNRLQIFSTKWSSLVDADTRSRWRMQNVTSMRAVRSLAGDGGQFVVLYAEGGRGEGSLLAGDPATMQIPGQSHLNP